MKRLGNMRGGESLRGLILSLLVIPASGWAADGAVSGGGGGTLPAAPVHAFEITKIVEHAFAEMRLVARELDRSRYRSTETALEKKLFGGAKTLLHVLEETGYEVRENKPCYDLDGNEVDASILAADPNDICISAYRIAPKVVTERARIETIALIFHELSHKVGTTEAEATELQQDVARRLSRSTLPDWKMNLTVYDRATSAFNMLKRVALAIEAGEPADAIDAKLDDALVRVNELFTSLFPLAPASYYSRRQTEYVSWLRARVNIAVAAARLRFVGKGLDQDYLDDIFGSSKTVLYEIYLRRGMGSSYDGDDFRNNVLERPETPADIAAEFKNLAASFARESAFLYAFNADLALHTHAADDRGVGPNPFAVFVGTYDLVNLLCQASGIKNPQDRIPASIELVASNSSPGEVDVKKSWRSRWSTETYQENGGGEAMKLTGDGPVGARWAQAVSSYRTRWSSPWHETMMRVEERADGLYFVESFQWRERSFASGPAIHSRYRCEAKLVPR